MDDMDAEALASRLEHHPDFRVLRRLDTSRSPPALAGSDISRGVILDTETTGMDPAADKLIELGLLAFEYSRESCQIGRVLGSYSGLEDPGRPIPPESTAIHHITDEMVRGLRLDEPAIERLLGGAGVVIAHNAGFDRPFVEARLPVFRGLPWACSLREVPWDAAGIGSAKLEYLAYRSGFFYEGHRAEVDCRALLEVLRRPFGESGASGLKPLLDSAREPSLRLWALGSPFDSKDLLKARGYRWEPEKRCWYADIARATLEAELAWLKQAVFAGKGATIEVETFDAKTRYSGRDGKKERMRV